MYITRVELDFTNRKNIKNLSTLQSYHNYIEQSFPEEIRNKNRSRKLWRVDQIGEKTYLIVVSENKPDKEKLEKFALKGTYETKDYDKFLSKIKNGQKARFKVVLNPTVSIKEGEESKRGKIVPLKPSDYKKYIMDRSEKNGFILNDNDFLVSSRTVVNFKHSKESKNIKLDKVTYEGVLTINDTEKMSRTLQSGIGKKRAYGFGLMTLILEN